MGEPDVLRLFAKHYLSSEVIPDELIAKLQVSAKFNQGFAAVEYMAAAYLDRDWRTRTADARAFLFRPVSKLQR